MNDLLDKILETVGIQPTDVGLEENADEEFSDLIEFYMDTSIDWINTYTSQEYNELTLPAGLQGVLLDIVKRILSNDTIRQDLPTMDNDNYRVFSLIDGVITPEIQQRLDPYKAKAKVSDLGIFTINGKTYDTSNDDDGYNFV